MADNEEQEKTYEVKDKRRVNADGTLKEEPEPEETGALEEAAEAPKEEPAPPGDEGPAMPPPSVYDMLQFVMGLLSEQAWVQMGIHLAPGQKETTKDLAQAKLAIDTIVFIADKLNPHLGEDERKAVRSLISDLQLNFVRQS